MKLLQGGCLELMQTIPSGSVDMVLADPPYGTIADLKLKTWDAEKTKWDVKIPTGAMLEEVARVLRPNGRAVLFAQEPYTRELMNSALPSLPFSYRAIWYKDHHANPFNAKKAMVNFFEDICIFSKVCPKRDFEGENPLRAYFKNVLEFIGAKSAKDINKELGHRKAEHCFYVTEGKKTIREELGGKTDHMSRIGSSQFELCTEQTYGELIEKFNIDKMPGFRKWEDLRKIQDDFKESYNQNGYKAPTFNLWQGRGAKPNVLEYPKEIQRFHPTQKPVLLLEDLIKTYTNPGDVVLDFCMGSGSAGVACTHTGREFIGIELKKKYFEIAKRRIENEAIQQHETDRKTRLFSGCSGVAICGGTGGNDNNSTAIKNGVLGF